MKKLIILICMITAFININAQSKCPYPKKAPKWFVESIKKHDQRMKWWDKAKFGMFIHWGVYSDLAGVWKGKPVKGYSEHIFRKCKIPLEVYKKQVAANFNPDKFSAEEWVELCKDAGMKYMVITANSLLPGLMTHSLNIISICVNDKSTIIIWMVFT